MKKSVIIISLLVIQYYPVNQAKSVLDTGSVLNGGSGTCDTDKKCAKGFRCDLLHGTCRPCGTTGSSCNIDHDCCDNFACDGMTCTKKMEPIGPSSKSSSEQEGTPSSLSSL